MGGGEGFSIFLFVDAVVVVVVVANEILGFPDFRFRCCLFFQSKIFSEEHDFFRGRPFQSKIFSEEQDLFRARP